MQELHFQVVAHTFFYSPLQSHKVHVKIILDQTGLQCADIRSPRDIDRAVCLSRCRLFESQMLICSLYSQSKKKKSFTFNSIEIRAQSNASPKEAKCIQYCDYCIFSQEEKITVNFTVTSLFIIGK